MNGTVQIKKHQWTGQLWLTCDQGKVQLWHVLKLKNTSKKMYPILNMKSGKFYFKSDEVDMGTSGGFNLRLQCKGKWK